MVNAFRQLANATRLVGFCVMQFTIDLKDTHARIKIRTPRRNRDTFQEWKERGPFLHVRHLCGRPADVEHRREEAVTGGPDEVRVSPQDGAEQAATEDGGEGDAHQDGSSDVPQLETAKPVDLNDSTSSVVHRFVRMD
jgi:hypothetical protein